MSFVHVTELLTEKLVFFYLYICRFLSADTFVQETAEYVWYHHTLSRKRIIDDIQILQK